MPDIKILTERDLRALVPLDAEAVACMEEAFRLLATRPVAMPPVMSFEVPEHNGEVDVKTAYVPGIEVFAIKMSPGFFDNPKLGLPSLNGLMVLFSARTGLVEAVMLDNGYLTAVRTAATGALAAKWLSRADAKTAGIIGGGEQARLQLQALGLVRPLERARVWARDPERAAACARDCAEALGLEVAVAESAEALVAQSDIVVTATSAQAPVIEAAWLRDGQHVTAMGADADYKNEVAPEALAKVGLYVPDRLSQCAERGELRPAIQAGVLSADDSFPELGEIIAGKAPGRTSAAMITLADLTGTGVQDTAIAALAAKRATAAGAGSIVHS